MTENPVTVTFFWGGSEDLEELRGLDSDRDWKALWGGARAWILQSFLRLRNAGYPVELSRTVPLGRLFVFHAADFRRTLPQWRRLRKSPLIAVRGDRKRTLTAD